MIRQPQYYDSFHCLAVSCRHCCCMGWQVEMDEETIEKYEKTEGELGERLRASISKGKRKYLIFPDGKCRFLTKEHLCSLAILSGDTLLCDTCKDYPRMEEAYGELTERVLSISCEEAGRLLFESQTPVTFVTKQEEEESKIFDRVYKDLYIIRKRSISLMQNRAYSVRERMKLLLSYAKNVQDNLDSHLNGYLELNPQTLERKEKKNNENLHKWACIRMELLEKMDALSEEWKEEFFQMKAQFYGADKKKDYLAAYEAFDTERKEYEYEYENLMVYLLYRYVLLAGIDHRYFDRIRFCLFCCILIHDLDCARYQRQGQYTMNDRTDVARLFSRQIEHSQMSCSYLRKKIWTSEIFSLEAMMEQI